MNIPRACYDLVYLTPSGHEQHVIGAVAGKLDWLRGRQYAGEQRHPGRRYRIRWLNWTKLGTPYTGDLVPGDFVE